VAKPWLRRRYPSCCLSADGPSPLVRLYSPPALSQIGRLLRAACSVRPPSFGLATNPPGEPIRPTQTSQAATSEMCSVPAWIHATLASSIAFSYEPGSHGSALSEMKSQTPDPRGLRARLLTFFHLFAPTCSSPKKPTWNEQVDISRSIKYPTGRSCLFTSPVRFPPVGSSWQLKLMFHLACSTSSRLPRLYSQK